MVQINFLRNVFTAFQYLSENWEGEMSPSYFQTIRTSENRICRNFSPSYSICRAGEAEWWQWWSGLSVNILWCGWQWCYCCTVSSWSSLLFCGLSVGLLKLQGEQLLTFFGTILIFFFFNPSWQIFLEECIYRASFFSSLLAQSQRMLQ